ncbi:MAG: hypothetical protein JNJ59_06140 [Deltaproteobacteria bacterium]|nr:hypothetical protein [Deltaproteobacteria bacterium]
MALDTHDLALDLDQLRADPAARVSFLAGGLEHELVRLPPGARHESVARIAGTVLVLEGTGTVAVDDWRATLAGGLLVTVPQDAKLVLTADAGVPFALLFVHCAHRGLPPRDASEAGSEGAD